MWVAVLGLSLYALIGGVTAISFQIVKSYYSSQTAVVVVAWFLMIAAVLFGFLWLSEDVPALLSGTTPQSLVEMGIPTNPVHVLDLGFFLPAVIVTGVLLLRRYALAYTLAPSFIVFLILTGVPILITPAVQASLGQQAGWSVFIPIGSLILLSLILLAWLLSTLHPGE